MPKVQQNHKNYIISLANLCRWLAEQAENLGVEIFPGFAASKLLYNSDNSLKGVQTGDMGLDADGNQKSSYEPGFEFHAKYTIFAEGCRGHLGKEIINKYALDADCDPQHYGIGIKEVWEVPSDQHNEGVVVHTAGYPMIKNSEAASSGGFLYHTEDNKVSLGLIMDLSYSNPHISPFDEFQKFKHHPVVKNVIADGKRLSYGARALVKGGLNSLPKMSFPGGLLIGSTINMAPKLFKSAVADVPFVDVLNTILDASLPLTPPEWEEWGNPILNKNDFLSIQSYSPYDNVRKQEYPSLLVTAGLTDPRAVSYTHLTLPTKA